jgi:hypothetical protein
VHASNSSSAKKSKMGYEQQHMKFYHFVRILALLLLLDCSWITGAEFLPFEDRQAKSVISFNGLMLDRPKIRVLSYRVRNFNPNSITEEVSASCRQGKSNCDELVILDQQQQQYRLGQDNDETKEWSIPPNVTHLTLLCSSKSGPVEWDYQGKGVSKLIYCVKL